MRWGLFFIPLGHKLIASFFRGGVWTESTLGEGPRVWHPESGVLKGHILDSKHSKGLPPKWIH